MQLKPTMRKATELGIGLTAIATLILAGCGGSTSSSTPAVATITLTISPSLGRFKEGTTVRIKDNSGAQVGSGYVNASGVAAVAVPTGAQGPLLIEAGLNGDQYFDEQKNQFVAVSNINGVAVRALLPDLAVASDVGVTALTEIAVGSLANASGVLPADISAASAVGANNAVANTFGVTDPLTPPKLVGSAADISALGSTTAADKYAAKLAVLANMAGSNEDALQVAHRLRNAMAGLSPASNVNAVIAAFNAAATKTTGVPSNARITPPSASGAIKLNDLASTAANNAKLAQQVLLQQLGSTKPTQAQIIQAYTTAMQHYTSAVQTAFANGSSIAAAANTANANASAALVAFFPSVITPGAGASNGKVCVGDAVINGISVAKFCYTNLTANFSCSQTGIQGAGGSMPTSVGPATFSFSLAAACPANAMMSFDVSKFVGGVAGGSTGGSSGGSTNGSNGGQTGGSTGGSTNGATSAQTACKTSGGMWDPFINVCLPASVTGSGGAATGGTASGVTGGTAAGSTGSATGSTGATSNTTASGTASYLNQGGLTWMPPTFNDTWTNAQAYCTNTTINGQTGWRMPTNVELRALISSGVMKGQGWPDVYGKAWSSTSAGGGSHYIVDLSGGGMSDLADTYKYYVSCVRSSSSGGITGGATGSSTTGTTAGGAANGATGNATVCNGTQPPGFNISQSGKTVNVTTAGCVPPPTGSYCNVSSPSATGISVLQTAKAQSASLKGLTYNGPGVNPYDSNTLASTVAVTVCTINAPANLVGLNVNLNACFDLTSQMGALTSIPSILTVSKPVTLSYVGEVNMQSVPDCYKSGAAVITDALTGKTVSKQADGSYR